MPLRKNPIHTPVRGVNVCSGPPCAAVPGATCRATAGAAVPSAAPGAWTGLSGAI